MDLQGGGWVGSGLKVGSRGVLCRHDMRCGWENQTDNYPPAGDLVWGTLRGHLSG